jgi:hypothetical protein
MKKKWIWIGIASAGLFCFLVMGAGILLFTYQQHSSQADQWGPEYSTKGMSLTLTEVSRQKDQNGATDINYAVSTTGVPQAQTYTLLAKNFSDESPMQSSEFRIDDSGKLLDAKNGQPFNYFSAGNYAMGQALNMALVNSDRSIKVYAKVIPFPIEATDGKGCRLSAELDSRDGFIFIISGEGFKPNENVTLNRQASNTGFTNSTQQVDAAGAFSLFEFAGGANESGSVALNAIGKSCDLTIHYEYGAPALQIQ